jgi:FPC/CPF motif-containing protein YcgG
MNQNEKTATLQSDGSNIRTITMNNNNTNHEIKQPNFSFGKPPEIIICFNCHREAELDGYLFRLVPVCFNCRTESEVLITRNRFERRRAAR